MVTSVKPKILITLGDVAGIGPEIVVRAWLKPCLHELCCPVIVGDVKRLEATLRHLDYSAQIVQIDSLAAIWETQPHQLICIQSTSENLDSIPLGEVNPRAGKAAYDFLIAAIDLAMNRQAAAIVTAPLHKMALKAAGIPFPGHTEILADRTGVSKFAMMLYGKGLAINHVTLHVGLREVLAGITHSNIVEKIELLHEWLCMFNGSPPKLGVCALNPHASDGGLMGDEEARIISPAIATTQSKGIRASGPWPSDTLFRRAFQGEFQGVVAMYHDQGHIPMKLMADWAMVNVTLGLPILRTSVAHGTAFDIASHFRADSASLLEAVRVAVQWAKQSNVRS